MKTRLSTNIDGNLLRLSFLPEEAHCDCFGLILSVGNEKGESGPGFNIFPLFQAKRRFEGQSPRNCLYSIVSSIAHKTLLYRSKTIILGLQQDPALKKSLFENESKLYQFLVQEDHSCVSGASFLKFCKYQVSSIPVYKKVKLIQAQQFLEN